MNTRLELHEKLCDILGSRNVYYQPPENIKIKYPCIMYSREAGENNFANNNKYKQNRKYKLILVDASPENIVSDKIESMMYCRFVTMYSKNNLNHYVYNLYY